MRDAYRPSQIVDAYYKALTVPRAILPSPDSAVVHAFGLDTEQRYAMKNSELLMQALGKKPIDPVQVEYARSRLDEWITHTALSEQLGRTAYGREYSVQFAPSIFEMGEDGDPGSDLLICKSMGSVYVPYLAVDVKRTKGWSLDRLTGQKIFQFGYAHRLNAPHIRSPLNKWRSDELKNMTYSSWIKGKVRRELKLPKLTEERSPHLDQIDSIGVYLVRNIAHTLFSASYNSLNHHHSDPRSFYHKQELTDHDWLIACNKLYAIEEMFSRLSREPFHIESEPTYHTISYALH